MIYAALYVAIIVAVNVFFGWGEWWPLVANVVVGAGFIVRDFAQRSLGDRVLWATILGVGISFFMAGPGVAVPSAVAFAVAETTDWYIVRRLQHRSMRERVLLSHVVSVPLDTALFLGGLVLGIGLPWSWPGFLRMTSMKSLALVALAWVRR